MQRWLGVPFPLGLGVFDLRLGAVLIAHPLGHHHSVFLVDRGNAAVVGSVLEQQRGPEMRGYVSVSESLFIQH
jgi:hypothetical protein